MQYLLRSAADVLVLSEFKMSLISQPFSEGLATAGYSARTCFADALEKEGFDYRSVSKIAGSRELGVAVFSRLPAAPVEICPQPDDARLITALDIGGIVVAGVYQNRWDSPETKKTLFEYLNEPPSEFSGRPVLLTGDFNTGRDDVDREEGSTRYYCADQFAQMTEKGWVDLWRTRHGEQAREYTWKLSHCYRLDHAFGRGGLERQVVDCRYDHRTRLAYDAGSKVSDHSAMVVELEGNRLR